MFVRSHFVFVKDSDSYADYYDYEESEYTVDPVTADLGRPTKKPNVTTSLQPSITGLNLSSISASTDQHPPASTPQTIVVIHEKPSHQNETEDSKKTESSSVSYQPDEIPVQVIVEPLLKKRPPQSMKRKVSNRQVGGKADADVDEELLTRPRPRRAQMLERMRARRAQNKMSRNGNGCGRRAISDGQGGCRVRRSGMSGFLDFLTKFLPKGDSA